MIVLTLDCVFFEDLVFSPRSCCGLRLGHHSLGPPPNGIKPDASPISAVTTARSGMQPSVARVRTGAPAMRPPSTAHTSTVLDSPWCDDRGGWGVGGVCSCAMVVWWMLITGQRAHVPEQWLRVTIRSGSPLFVVSTLPLVYSVILITLPFLFPLPTPKKKKKHVNRNTGRPLLPNLQRHRRVLVTDKADGRHACHYLPLRLLSRPAGRVRSLAW